MADPVHYRNKATVRLGRDADGRPLAGFYARASHRLVDVYGCGGSCRLQEAGNNDFLAALLSLPAGRRSGEKLPASVSVRSGLLAADQPVPALSSDLPAAIRRRLPSGRPPLVEPLTISCAGLPFQVAHRSFFQANTRQAARLVAVVNQFLDQAAVAAGILVDLFCGVGLFALTQAGRFRRVYGVEAAASAIDDARRNQEIAGAANVRWLQGRAEVEFARLLAGGIKPDVVLLDPPRGGCQPELLRQLLAPPLPWLIYVSCDPLTLARDLGRLTAGGYRVAAVQPVDMFPHTYHLETVVLLAGR